MIYRADVKRKWDPGRAYPVFVTLTLPMDQEHTDAEINRKCLQPFLIRCRRDYGVDHYFWRAEAQENGRLHYHLLMDRYIPKEYLQAVWNMSLQALGYLDRYFLATGSIRPPSTDVHRIRDKVKDRKTGQWKTVDPVDYLLDYIMDTPAPAKEEEIEGKESEEPRKLIGRYRHSDGVIEEYVTRPIDGRVWGMSDSLRAIREPRASATVDLVQTLERAREQGRLRRVDQEHATMYFGPVGVILSRARASNWKLLQTYYLQVFHHLYPDQLPRGHSVVRAPLNVESLWIDLEAVALYNRVESRDQVETFGTAAELERYMDRKARAGRMDLRQVA